MKKILLILITALTLNAFSQHEFASDEVYISIYNFNTKSYELSSVEKEITIFNFEDDYTILDIKGYINDRIITGNFQVIGNKVEFVAKTKNLTELLCYIDYDFNLIKLVSEIDGQVIMMSFSITAQKENYK